MGHGNTQEAVFAGGCFWCTEAIFERLKGVMSVMPGYAGGTTQNPTYQQVSAGNTGHAEAVKVIYDQDVITYRDLLTVFFATHDPTTLNRQGADVGTRYRSVIFYTTQAQKQESESFIKGLNKSEPKVVTHIQPLEAFYEAEDYHKDYYQNNTSAPYCQVVINPKIKKLKKRFKELIKS